MIRITTELDAEFTPKNQKNNQNEINVSLKIKNNSKDYYWYEFEIGVNDPLSLVYDRKLSKGKFRLGILNSTEEKIKEFRIYNLEKNQNPIYNFNITMYVYDKDGAISERLDRNFEDQ